MPPKTWLPLCLLVPLVLTCAAAAAPKTAAKPGTWTADGVIADDEYQKSQQLGDLEVCVRVDGDDVSLALRGRTTGYLALGIGAERAMKNADILMFYVRDGRAYAEDTYSTGIFGPHLPDVKLGGRDDIEQVGGSEADGITVVEFRRKLDTGDPRDKPLRPGENKVIWAVGRGDDINAKHIRRGSGILNL